MQLSVIQKKTFEMREQKVMLDFDLPAFYEVETRALKQPVKRNIERFPEDFMFQLNPKEANNRITICDTIKKISWRSITFCIY